MVFYKRQKNKAFTLVELMIATSLFTIIMLMGIGSLIVSSDSARASQKLRIAVDNVNFAMESMTRELRTGSYFYCGGSGSMIPNSVNDCSSTPEDIITFNPQEVPGGPSRIGYYREVRNNSNPVTYTLIRCVDSASPNTCSDIVSSNVDVRSLKFLVKGSSPTDMIQPSAQIFMSGVVKVKNVEIPFSLQSMASQRSAEN